MLDFAIKLARTAGAEAMKHFGRLRPFEVSTKGTVRDLVSVADKAVEELIITEIKERYPDHDIFGEETGKTGSSSDYCWVIDPIDGTQNFVKNIPVFSVSIGVKFKGEVICGCVFQPALDTLFYAEKGKGAFENGKLIRVSDCSSVEEAVCSTGFVCLRNGLKRNNMPYFTKLAPQLRSVLRTGSAAYDLCLVASGRADGFWEIGLNDYDVAGGSIIAKEAGAVVTDLGGGNDYPAEGLLCAAPELHKKMLPYFQ